MELEKFDRQLRLMVLLTQNRLLTIDDISRELGMSKRSIYRYVEAFRQMGFIVIKEGTRYRLDHSSPFFHTVTERIHFSTEEAITIGQVLNSVLDNSPQVRHLREKLSALYDPKVLARHGVDDKVARNLATLFEAMQEERVVMLRNYASPNSGQTSNRIVEPYLFLAENSEVRCYEVTTGMNKTFKIGRAESVEKLDLLWLHKEEFKPFSTDLFHFSGEQRFEVTLLLGRLATSLLLEEYPGAEPHLTLCDDGRHRLCIEVCSFKGIGRFVLGLSDDIEVVGSPEFIAYLKARAQDLTKKLGV